jgi:hypothetical protein
MLPTINAATVDLPDDEKLLRELRGLERRRGLAGRDRVDHAPGQHDDRTNAVAGLIFGLAMDRPEKVTALVVPELYRRSPWSVFETMS